MTGLSELEERAVKPFYLPMMGLNAVQGQVDLPGLAAVGRVTSDDEVVQLLRGLWRPRVMGAWLAAGRTSAEVREALPLSLATSAGTLTAPPLATVALLELGPGAAPALTTYLGRALEDADLGSHEFVAAALERLDAPVPAGLVTDHWRGRLDRMLDVARALAEARPAPPS